MAGNKLTLDQSLVRAYDQSLHSIGSSETRLMLFSSQAERILLEYGMTGDAKADIEQKIEQMKMLLAADIEEEAVRRKESQLQRRKEIGKARRPILYAFIASMLIITLLVGLDKMYGV